MTELDDRVLQRVAAARSPRPDAVIEIRYMEHGPGQRSVFEVAPLVAHLRSLLARARPLRAGDVALPNEVAPDIEASARLDPARIEAVKSVADGLEPRPRRVPCGARPAARRPAGAPAGRARRHRRLRRRRRVAARARGRARPAAERLGLRARVAARPVRRARQAAARARRAVGRAADRVRPDRSKRSSRCRAARRTRTGSGSSSGRRRVVSTTLDPLPASVPDLRTLVAAKGAALEARRDAFEQLADTADPRLSRLLAGIAALLPLVGVRPRAVRRQARRGRGRRVRDHPRRRRHRRGATTCGAGSRPPRSSSTPTTPPGPGRRGSRRCSRPAGRCWARTRCSSPSSRFPPTQGDELARRRWRRRASCSSISTNDTEVEFPVDEWLYGARARARADAHLEQATRARGRSIARACAARTAPARRRRALAGARLPAGPDDRQRAPALHGALRDRRSPRPRRSAACCSTSGPRSSPADGEHRHHVPLRPAQQRAAAGAAARHARHLGRRLAVGRPHRRADRDARPGRASAPSSRVHVDATAYARFLPATIMAATLHGISIATALAANNHVYEFVEARRWLSWLADQGPRRRPARAAAADRHRVEPARGPAADARRSTARCGPRCATPCGC